MRVNNAIFAPYYQLIFVYDIKTKCQQAQIHI